MSSEVIITRGYTGFRVQTRDMGLIAALESLHDSLTKPKLQRERGRIFAIPGDKFYVPSPKEHGYYYINAIYETVENLIRNARTSQPIKIVEKYFPEFGGADVVFDRHKLNLVEEGDYEYQNGIVDFATEPDRRHTTLEVPTGYGKTKLSMKTAVKKKKRIIVVTKAGFVDKWIGDLKADLDLRPGELIKIDGLKGLAEMLHIGLAGRMEKMDKNDKEIKAMVISSHAIDDYIELFLTKDVVVHPSEVLKVLGVGFLVYDESHMLFRKNYWSFIMLNIPQLMDLSATLQPDDAFLKLRYLERFPPPSRYDKLQFEKYIDAFGIMYGIRDYQLVGKVNRMQMYNHLTFEGWMSKTKKQQVSYFTMVDQVLEKLFFATHEKGQKVLVFFSTKQMCTDFAKWIKERHKTFRVERYIQGDKYDTMKLGDIIVSTPGKSGTAVDIPGLLMSLSTVMIDDTQANLQMLGRTRRIKGLTPKMVYLFCRGIKKHVAYHKKRMMMYRSKVKNHLVMNSSFNV